VLTDSGTLRASGRRLFPVPFLRLSPAPTPHLAGAGSRPGLRSVVFEIPIPAFPWRYEVPRTGGEEAPTLAETTPLLSHTHVQS
jgi:hypothetical protein